MLYSLNPTECIPRDTWNITNISVIKARDTVKGETEKHKARKT